MPLGYQTVSWNKVFRNDKIKNIKFDIDIAVGEDELWFFNVLKTIKKVFLLSEPLYYYVQRKDSTMNSEHVMNKKWLTAIESKKKIIKLLEGNEKYYELFQAKIYNDLFPLLWYSYLSEDKENYGEIGQFLGLYSSLFYN